MTSGRAGAKRTPAAKRAAGATRTPAAKRARVSAKRARTADVRGALLDAAVAVLERDGVSGLTVRAVATQADVAPMGVYNHLDGKDGLINAVLDRGFDGLRAAITPPRLPVKLVADDPWARLRESGRGYRRFAVDNPAVYGLMFGGEVGYDDPDSCAAGAFGVLVELVGEAQEREAVRAGDPLSIAMQIWSCVHGAVSVELSGSGQLVDAEVNYEAILELIVRGLLP